MVSGILLLTGLSILSRAPYISIKNISVSGAKFVSSDDLANQARKTLAGSYYGLFAKNNILLYPKSEIEKSITSDFSRVKDVQVSSDGKNGIKLLVSEYKPDSLWCAGGGDDPFSDDCYYMDDQGYLFAKAPQFSGKVFFMYYGLLLGENPVGQNYLQAPNPSYAQVSELVKSVEGINLNPVRLYASSQGDFYLYLENGTKIIFSNSQSDLVQVFDNLSVLMNSGEVTDKTGGLIPGIDYIDMRFGNKVYYKMKSQ